MEPRRSQPSLAADVARSIGRYLKGQLKVSAILSVLYAIGFAISHVPLWWLFGPVAGLANLAPMAGSLTAMLLAAGATALFGEWRNILGIAITFAVVQTVESFFLTPRIVGREMSAPPLAVFAALLIGGSVFGFFGMLFAAPALGVLLLIWRRTGGGSRDGGGGRAAQRGGI